MKARALNNDIHKFVEFYRNHFYYYKQELGSLKSELRFEEIKWRANWFYLIARMLENYFQSKGGLQIIEGDTSSHWGWHSDHAQNYFPGHFYLNCMLQLIARKGEIRRLKLEYQEKDAKLYELSDMIKIRANE